MRQRASWMKPKDDIILETLNIGAALSISGIAVNSKMQTPPGVSERTLRRRLDDLIAGGLVEEVGPNDRFYRITVDGKRYLDGKHQPADLDEDDEE